MALVTCGLYLDKNIMNFVEAVWNVKRWLIKIWIFLISKFTFLLSHNKSFLCFYIFHTFLEYIVLSSSNSLPLSIYPSPSMLCSIIWIKYKFIDLHKMYYPQFILCCIFSCFLSLSYFLLILTINYVLSRLFDWLKLKVCFKIAKLPIVHKNIHFKICFSYY